MNNNIYSEIEASVNTATPIELKTLPEVIKELHSFEWIDDEERTLKLIKDLTALLISFDTVTETGKDLSKVPEILSSIFGPLGYEIKKQGGYPKRGMYFLMYDSHRALPYFANRVQIPFAVHFHLDTVKFSGLSDNNPRIDCFNNIIGRGSTDVKGLAASLIVAIATLKFYDIKTPPILITTDEENGNIYSSGSFLSDLKIQSLIDFEPTANVRGGILKEVPPNSVYKFALLKEGSRPSIEQIQRQLQLYFPENNIKNIFFDKGTIAITFNGNHDFKNDPRLRSFTSSLGLFYQFNSNSNGFIIADSPIYNIARDTLKKYFKPSLENPYPEMNSTIAPEDFDSQTREFSMSGGFNCTYALHFNHIPGAVVGIPEGGFGRHTEYELQISNNQLIFKDYAAELISSIMHIIEP